MPLPAERLSFPLILRNEFSAPPSSVISLAGRASTAPLTQRVTYEHAAPLWASEFPLILGNECSALQSLLSVELTLLPSPRGSPMSIPLPSERLSFLSFWGMSSPPSRARAGQASLLPSFRGSSMSRPLPSERLSSPLILTNEFSALQSSCWSS